jgi:hypothetical protein
MTDLRKRILAGGILFLCLLSLVWTNDDGKMIGLTELLALSGAWACAVWLWGAKATKLVLCWWKRGAACVACIFGALFLWRITTYTIPTWAVADRWGIQFNEADRILSYWERTGTRVNDERQLIKMSKEDAQATLRQWLSNPRNY